MDKVNPHSNQDPVSNSLPILANLRSFAFEGAPVRIMGEADSTWFVLTDICQILEIANTGNAAARLDPDEKQGIRLTDTLINQGFNNFTPGTSLTIINESGMWRLIMRSDKPVAKRLQKWVFSEVLPAIRKTGSYAVVPAQQKPLTQLAALREALDGWEAAEAAHQQEIAAHIETKVLAITYQKQAEAAESHAKDVEMDYAGLKSMIYAVADASGGEALHVCSVRSAAKGLGVMENFLWKLLRDMDADIGGGQHPLGWLKYEKHKGKNDQDEPYAFAKFTGERVAGCRMTRMLVECRNKPHSDGSPRFEWQTFFLESGLARIKAICDNIPEEVKNRAAWEQKQRDVRKAARKANSKNNKAA